MPEPPVGPVGIGGGEPPLPVGPGGGKLPPGGRNWLPEPLWLKEPPGPEPPGKLPGPEPPGGKVPPGGIIGSVVVDTVVAVVEAVEVVPERVVDDDPVGVKVVLVSV
jgi:hypothetical protein